ncbi:MAG: PilT/PilU family type 4a pilus ATPase [Candidatus Omnitrophota bacterium]
MNISRILKLMVEQESSDLFLRANAAPHVRVHGKLRILDAQVLSKNDMLTITDFLLANDNQREIYAKELDIDFIHQEPGIGRFRVNIFTQRGSPSIVARYVTDAVHSFEDLNLPVELCRQFCEEPRGLVLVCGPAGSGKSTTIASMVEYVNATIEKHIVTIEDPIEFLFRDKKSIINQRELGIDVPSYPAALKHVTQQSPDIIFIGTIRDEPTMKAAISAAELGVLVMSTFHTINAIQTIERIVNFFPPHLHSEVRMQLSLLLKGVISLRLIPRKDGKGRIPAFETMVVTPTIARLIREGSITQIQSFIDEGHLFGMQSFKQSLVKLVKANMIHEDDARYLADSRDEFDLELRGIKSRH